MPDFLLEKIMPSSTIAQILEIKDIRPHPDADRLELATLGGWQIVCGKDLYKEGERVVYVTPDSLITTELATRLDILQHLSSVKNPDGTFVTNDRGEQMWRVRQAKLRGEPSFGTTVPRDIVIELTSKDANGKDLAGCDIQGLEIGYNMAEHLGIMKYEPAMRSSAGDAEVDHPLFPKYTSIENIRNFPNVLEEGEPVAISEKIHGTNCRVGLIEGEFMVGSHGLRRKHGEGQEWSMYSFPLTQEPVVNLLKALEAAGYNQVVIYGELFGRNIQKKYTYGTPNAMQFRAFDILVDGKYMHVEGFRAICEEMGVPMVPTFHNMSYNYDNIVQCVEDMANASTLSDQHPMEGVVIRPLAERDDRRVGRVVLKYVTNKYLFDKGGSDYTDY